MLEIKNLKKVYKTKGGQEVKALDDVSVTFPETGMVFLLGKSGSGKSTLLNVTGGLDKPDSGEIIIKGKNSKDFSGADFDSYRNTYIGFIFQEYNILNEFNIEQNIELALQLQGKKNDKESVLKLLEQVDLKGLGKRKPNTLSGGQKQRVAIARALIKNPEIIMADEPTGALDSNTGKQVFDTLKKLSKEKLVIIVSHDRDFAEIYADRIIELADGKIISDMTKAHIEPKSLNENINIVNDNVLSIKNVEELKRDDLDKIYDLLKSKNGEVIISTSDHDNKAIKQAIHISEDNRSEVFSDTKEVNTKEYDPKNTKFIKSHLPFQRAFKIGASSLKSKPIRMIFTIFLTIVALVMFGVTSTLMLYDESYSVKEALKNTDLDYEQISKTYKFENIGHNLNISTGEDKVTYKNTEYLETAFSSSDINYLNSKSANKYAGVIKFGSYNYYSGASRVLRIESMNLASSNYYPYVAMTGLVDAGINYITSNGFTITGSYPSNYTEIAITDYMYQMLKEGNPDQVKSYDDILNKTVTCRFGFSGYNVELKITGIINTGMIPTKYNDLKNNTSNLNQNELDKLAEEFKLYIGNSFHLMGYVSNDFYKEYMKDYEVYTYDYINTIWARGIAMNESNDVYSYEVSDDYGIGYVSPLIVEKNINKLKFYDFNDNKIEYRKPSENEIYLSKDLLNNIKNNQNSLLLASFDNMVSSSYLTKDLYENIYPEQNKYFDLKNDAYIDKNALMQVKTIHDKYIDEFLRVSNIIEYGQYYLSYIENIPNYYSNETLKNKYDSVKQELNNINQEIDNRTYNYNSYINNLDTLLKNDSYVNNYLLIQSASRYSSENTEIRNMINDYNNGNEIDLVKLKQIMDSNNYHIIEYDLSYNSYLNSFNTDITKYYYKTSKGKTGELNVIGYYDGSGVILNDNFVSSNATIDNKNVFYSERKTDYVFPEDAIYDTLIVKTNFQESDINLMLANFGSYKYVMTNNTYQTLSIFLNIINTLKNVFLTIGIIFAVFAALMLFNFISSSISSKIREIGILRAVGARGSDLFKIFFSESGLISIICVILSVIISILVCNALNTNLVENIHISLLHFGIVNILLILAGSILIAFIGTFIPVLIASKKQPVESIRTL